MFTDVINLIHFNRNGLLFATSGVAFYWSFQTIQASGTSTLASLSGLSDLVHFYKQSMTPTSSASSSVHRPKNQRNIQVG